MKHIRLFLTGILIFALVFGILSSLGYKSFKTVKAVFADNDINNASSINTNQENTSLRLMTYNIHRGIGTNGKLNLAATADVIGKAKSDIVALQEVERFSPRTGFKDEIRYLSSKLDMNYAYGKSLNILMGEYGNGLLSKYPIEESKTIKLPSMKEQRTALRAVINIEGHRLAVYNVHLGLNESERQEQINYITHLLDSEKLDYVLMGDMNSGVDKLSSITEIMKDSALESPMYGQSTIEENDLQARIDYIFLSQSMKSTEYNVMITNASDHYPVVSAVKVMR